LSDTGVVIAQNLIQKLRIAETIDQNLSLLQRHKPYSESDHVLNIVYNFLTGGEALLDIERVQKHFKEVRYGGDSAFYDKKIVKMCDERGVEFLL